LGFEQIEAGKAFCLPCTPGKFGKVSDGIHICSECPKKTYSNTKTLKKQNNSCISCPHGRTSLSGAASCSACSTGKIKTGDAFNDFNCTDCTSGKVSQTGDSECKSCIVGLYQSNAGQGTCIPCKSGTWSNKTGSSSSFNCKKCTKGTYSTAEGASTNSTCNACPPGKSSQQVGATSSQACVLCEKGKISKSGSVVCTSCFRGQFTLEEGASSCSKCIVGRYGVDVDPLVNNADDCCVKCPLGWKRADEHEDLTKCIQCKQGETTLQNGSTSCSFCSIGQYGSVAGNCTKCPNGWYQSNKGQPNCLNDCEVDGEIPNDQATGKNQSILLFF